MAYETGSATNLHDLLGKLKTFASGLGWTVNKEGNNLATAPVDVKIDDSAQTTLNTTDSFPWRLNALPTTSASVLGGVINIDSPGNAIFCWQLGILDIGVQYEVSITIHTISNPDQIEYVELLLGGTNIRVGERMYSPGTYIYSGYCSTNNNFAIKTQYATTTFTVNYIRKVYNFSDLYLYHADAGNFNLYCDNTLHKVFPYTNPPPYLYVAAASGFNGNLEWHSQPDISPIAYSNKIRDDEYDPNIYKYHFFGETTHIYIVMEIVQGEFSHLGFGKCLQYFPFDTGQFCYGTVWNHDSYQNDSNIIYHNYPMGHKHDSPEYNTMRADLLGITGARYLTETDNTSYDTLDKLYGTYTGFYDDELPWVNSYYGTGPFMPVHFGGKDINGYTRPLGEMRGYRRADCRYVDPGQEIAISGEIWMVFPIKRKQVIGVPDYTSNSGVYALAYYKEDVS